MTIANIEIPVEYDMPALAEAAGNPRPEDRWYERGRLYVRKVTQTALNTALENYTHVDKSQDLQIASALAPTESRGELARKIEDVIDFIVNGTPLPVNPDTGKPYAQEWMEARRAERERLT